MAAPFDCWLALRGLQTLPLGMQAHCEGARRVAECTACTSACRERALPGAARRSGALSRKVK
ncbi:PLP-dependent transferase [Allomesorhizobium camelthorni]|uniref:PLP-dependent transferase n=1 Tax=Allomesorhizobium camelthorni TaxID=475069 RepID=UPI0031B5D47B